MIPNTQRIRIWSAVAFLLTVGCSRAPQTTQQETVAVASSNSLATPVAEVPETVVAAEAEAEKAAEPVTDPMIEQWADSLNAHFNSSEITLLNRTAARYQSIRSAADLAYFYQVLLRDSIQPLVEKHFRKGCAHADYSSFADDDWDWIGEVLPYIGTKVSCHHLDDGSVSCAHLAPISLLPLRDVATSTPEIEDDLFFDALIAIHTGTDPGQMIGLEVFDGQDNYHTRQNAGCEDCTVGMLGDGHRGEIISKLSQAARSRKLFSRAFAKDLSYLLGALQQEQYHHSKAAVLQELEEIIVTGSASRLLTKSEIAALQETQIWLQAKQDGFDCATGDCEAGTASLE